jgi:hypothetical protein
MRLLFAKTAEKAARRVLAREDSAEDQKEGEPEQGQESYGSKGRQDAAR